MAALRIALLACALALVLAGCGSGGSSKPVPADAVAVVGTAPVARSGFDALIREAQRQYAQKQQPFPQPGSAAYAKIRDTTVAFLVHTAQLDQKAAELGVTVTPAEVTRALDAIKRTQFHGDERAYESARDAQGLTEADLRENERTQLLTHKLFDKVTAGTTVGDQAVRDYYDLHQADYLAPDGRTVRHILVRTKPEAEHVIAQLKAGASFEDLERTVSLDQGPGRFLMPISKGDTVPNFEDAAFKLKVGQISQPIQTTFGWHVVQPLTPVRPSAVVPFALVKSAVTKDLLKKRRSTAMDQWLVDVQKLYCSGPERVRYGSAFRPQADPCKALAKS